MGSKKFAGRTIFECMILLACILGTAFLYLHGKPFQRGFYCSDESLYYPYKESTVGDILLYLIGTLFPLCSMVIVEWFQVSSLVDKNVLLLKKKWKLYINLLYFNVGVFLFGCVCSIFMTLVIKYNTGVLRPHFVDVCKPDWKRLNCSLGVYNYPVPCTTNDTGRLKESQLSFPSGHASFSSFSMVYLVIYVQKRLHLNVSWLLKPVLQLICFLLTAYVSLSRISDHKHHDSDVIFGFVLGTSIAILFAWCISSLFKADSKSRTAEELDASSVHSFTDSSENYCSNFQS